MLKRLVLFVPLAMFSLSSASFASHGGCHCDEQCKEQCQSGDSKDCECEACDCAETRQCHD